MLRVLLALGVVQSYLLFSKFLQASILRKAGARSLCGSLKHKRMHPISKTNNTLKLHENAFIQFYFADVYGRKTNQVQKHLEIYLYPSSIFGNKHSGFSFLIMSSTGCIYRD
uniref:Uncharacterized protein n=1 Tax=Cyprinodon variegatus TaxID=28743 RepID=A0A3Q2D3H3_CYPVA